MTQPEPARAAALELLTRMSAVWQAWLKSHYGEDMSFDDWFILTQGADNLAGFFSDADDIITELAPRPGDGG